MIKHAKNSGVKMHRWNHNYEIEWILQL
jgi:hypothetical protein